MPPAPKRKADTPNLNTVKLEGIARSLERISRQFDTIKRAGVGAISRKAEPRSRSRNEERRPAGRKDLDSADDELDDCISAIQDAEDSLDSAISEIDNVRVPNALAALRTIAQTLKSVESALTKAQSEIQAARDAEPD